MKISSYLEHRKQFKRDYFKALVFLNFESEWTYSGISGVPMAHDSCFWVHHKQQDIKIWTANSYWGLSLKIADREYGDVNILSIFLKGFIPWRRKLYDRACEVAAGGKARDYYG